MVQFLSGFSFLKITLGRQSALRACRCQYDSVRELEVISKGEDVVLANSHFSLALFLAEHLEKGDFRVQGGTGKWQCDKQPSRTY